MSEKKLPFDLRPDTARKTFTAAEHTGYDNDTSVEAEIDYLEAASAVETGVPLTLPVDRRTLYMGYQTFTTPGIMIQPMPDLATTRSGGYMVFSNNSTREGDIVRLTAFSPQAIDGRSVYDVLPGKFAAFLLVPAEQNSVLVDSTPAPTYPDVSVDFADIANVEKLTFHDCVADGTKENLEITPKKSYPAVSDGVTMTPEVKKTVFNNCMVTGDSDEVVVTPTIPDIPHLTVSDGTTEIEKVEKLTIVNSKLSGNAANAEVIPLIDFAEVGGGYGVFPSSALSVHPPMVVTRDPNRPDWADLNMVANAYEPKRPEGLYKSIEGTADIQGNVDINGGYSGRVNFDGGGIAYNNFITQDEDRKSIKLSPSIPADPLFGGKTVAKVFSRIMMLDNAPASGKIGYRLVNTADGTTVTDVKGQLMSYEKTVQNTDLLWVIEISGVVAFDTPVEYSPEIFYTFADNEFSVRLGDKVNGNSCVMIQYVNRDYESGDALGQCEQDLNINMLFDSYRLDTIADITPIIADPWAEETYTDDQFIKNGDGFIVKAITPVLAHGEAGKLSIDPINTTSPTYFTATTVFSSGQTVPLRGKEVRVMVDLNKVHTDLTVYPIYWAGQPDEYDKSIITHAFQGEDPIPASNWFILTDRKQAITKNLVVDDQTFIHNFTMPDEAVNGGFLVVPKTEIAEAQINITGWKVEVIDPFISWEDNPPERLSEKVLDFKDTHASFGAYTSAIGNYGKELTVAEQQLPIDLKKSGNADVFLFKQTPHYPYGALKFSSEGIATIKTKYSVQKYNKVNPDYRPVTFWWAYYVNTGGVITYPLVPNSNFEYEIDTFIPNWVVIDGPEFTINVTAETLIVPYGTATSDSQDSIGAANQHDPMMYVEITFNEKETSADLVVTAEAASRGYYLELDYDVSASKPIINMKQRS